MKLLSIYNKFLARHPFLGTCLTSAFGLGAGNLLCQIIMYPMTEKFDPLLFVTYALFGLLVSGPFVKVWWDALEFKIFKNPKQFLRPIKMMLLDQSTSPFILNGSFLYILALYGGKSHSEAVDDALNRCIPVCLESYKVWPMIMILNFYIIPPNNRVLFTNSISILWTTYFTYMVSGITQ